MPTPNRKSLPQKGSVEVRCPQQVRSSNHKSGSIRSPIRKKIKRWLHEVPCLILHITSVDLAFKKTKLTHPLVDMSWPLLEDLSDFVVPIVLSQISQVWLQVFILGSTLGHDSKHNSTRMTDHHAAPKTEFPDNLGAAATLIESPGRSLPNTFR